MVKRAVLGIIGVSDGDMEVHETLKEIVQAQVNAIVSELKKDGRVLIIEAECLVNSVQSGRICNTAGGKNGRNNKRMAACVCKITI